MREGWSDDEYLILFDAEAERLETAYGLAVALPGYRLIGLRGWDDFIVADRRGALFKIPTVPVDASFLEPFALPERLALKADARVTGRIKWYVTPLVFGGSPTMRENATWVSLEQHAQLVVWWNAKYREVRGGFSR